MSFRVGQKVQYVGLRVSVWHQIKRAIHPYTKPEKGVVYTVSNTYEFSDGEQAIELLELPSPGTEHWAAGFRALAFRPVVERKTDITAFQEILRKATRKRSVDA